MAEQNIVNKEFSSQSAKEKCNKRVGYKWNPLTKSCERISVIKEQPKEQKKTSLKDKIKSTAIQAVSNKLVGRPTTAPIPEPLPKAKYGGTESAEDRLLQIKANKEAETKQTTVPDPVYTTSEDATVTDKYGNVRPNIQVSPSYFNTKVKGQLEAMAELSRSGRLTAQEQAIVAQRQTELQQQLEGGSPIGGGQVGQGIGEEGQVSQIDMRQARLSLFSDPQSIMTIVGGGVVGSAAAAKTGALLGTSFGPWGTAIGAVAGVSLGIYSSINKNIKAQRTDILAAQKQVLTDTRTYGNQLIALMNTDPANADKYIESWKELQEKNAKAYSQLQIDTQSAKNLRFALDGTRELQKFENYYSGGGGYEFQRMKLERAIAEPNFEEGMNSLLMTQEDITPNE